MGGQACVLYGGAEFSRDLDLAIGIDPENLERIKGALGELAAARIFFPDLEAELLAKGHACHFRCMVDGAQGLRIDLMHKLRGCPHFDQLWEARTVAELPGGIEIPVLSLPWLVRAKKTQRDKDWPMIRRLVDTDITARLNESSDGDRAFWLQECRTPEVLLELASLFPAEAHACIARRPLLVHAIAGDAATLGGLLHDEEASERLADREYWLPLKLELEQWRRDASRQS